MIFVTGGTGYIGDLLIASLLEKGHAVKALYRDERKIARRHERLVWVKGSLDNPTEILHLDNCTAVCHIAAYARPWAANPDTYYQINRIATTQLARAAKTAGVGRFLFMSTAGVFGPSEDGLPRSEDQPKNTAHYTDYEQSKALAETDLFELTDHGFDVVVVNPSRVYGPGLLSDSNAVTRLAQLYAQGKFRFMPGSGRSVGNYVHVNDVVTGTVLALEKGQSGHQYILGGYNADYRQLFDYLAQTSRRRYKVWPMPLTVMLAASHAMTWRAGLTGKPPLITPPFVRKYAYNWPLSIEKARQHLNYQPIDLITGLHQTYDWLKTQNP